MSRSLYIFHVVVLLGVFKTGKNFALRIEIQPNKYNELISNGVHITCRPDNARNYEIVALEILNPRATPVATLNCGKDVKYYDTATTSQIQVDGEVAKNSSQNFLNLTLLTPTDHDGGHYTCVMYYLDATGSIKEERAKGELNILKELDTSILGNLLKKEMRKTARLEQMLKDMTVKDYETKDRIMILERKSYAMSQNISALEGNLQTQGHEVSSLQENAREQSQKISSLTNNEFKTTDRLRTLEGKALNTSGDISAFEEDMRQQRKEIDSIQENVRKQSQKLTVLTDKFTNTTAFFAKNAANIKLSTGTVLIFPDVLMNLGDGYNSRTGVFTAPKAGLYAFYLTVLTTCQACQADINLLAKGEIVATLFTRDDQTLDQSSVNILVQLNSGDIVNAVIKYAASHVLHSQTASAYGNSYSMFSGFLIKPL